MDVLRRMFDACVLRRAAIRIAAVDLNGTAIEVVAVLLVQVAAVEVSSLVAVADGSVSALRTVRVPMLLVTILAVHNSSKKWDAWRRN
jgi:hypothetical protein